MHHGYENGHRVPIHTDNQSDGNDPPTARDIAHAGFVGMMDYVAGSYRSESRQNIRSRTLASRWITHEYLNHSQKEFAKKNGIRPDSFCKAVNNFSKRFGIINRRMKPRADKPTYTYGKRVLPAVPRKRVP